MHVFPGTHPADRHTEVVIIGAGLAGLSAARRLVAAGVETLVLEARERVGGRTYTITTKDGIRLDLGGQWIGQNQQAIRILAEELGMTTFPTYDQGNNLEHREGLLHSYSGAVPLHDPALAMDLIEAMLELNMLAQEVPLEAPWEAPQAASWDGQTAATWITNNVESTGAQQWLTLAIQAIFSCEPRDLSLLHVLFYVHAAGSIHELISVTNGAQELRFHEGAQVLSERIAQALGTQVILQNPVHTIFQVDDGVQVESEQMTVHADKVIVAIPPTLAGRLRYRPPLPASRDQLTQRMPMGTVIKIHCLYPTPFWRAAGLSGQVASDTGIVRITFDNSPESGERGTLLTFIEGDEARFWSRQNAEERKTAVLARLVEYFGEQAAQPYDYIEQNWSEEEYSRGCYAAYMPTGVWTTYGEALRRPIGHIHWAGTETATIWNGYMDGAIRSGERAATEILQALARRS
jgi:monoamine oxidase